MPVAALPSGCHLYNVQWCLRYIVYHIRSVSPGTLLFGTMLLPILRNPTVVFVLQWIYQFLLRLFEAVFGPGSIGTYDGKQSTFFNFSREVQWPASPDNYFEPKTEQDIVHIMTKTDKQKRSVR